MYLSKSRLNHFFLILAGFFASSDIVWSMAASGFFKSTFGPMYVLMQGQSIFFVGLLSVAISAHFKCARGLLYLLMLFLSIGFYEWLSSCFFGTGRYGAEQLFFGFIYPVVLVLALTGSNKASLFFKFYYIGYIVYILAALLLLVCFDDILGRLLQYGVGRVVSTLRYSYEGSKFFLILGNVNKQSNYLLLSLLLGPYFLSGDKQKERRIYQIFAVLAVILIFLLGSRATLLLLPIVLYLNKSFFIKFKTEKHKILTGGAIIITFLAFLMLFRHEVLYIIKYAVFSMSSEYGDVNMLGTFSNRLNQWGQLKMVFSGPDLFIHGIGLGNYGLWLGGDINLGTHNLFLDHLLASGAYGVVMLVLIILTGFVKALQRRDKRLIFAYCAFLGLSFREYTFAFLHVTSMGGLVFIFLLYATYYKTAVTPPSELRPHRLGNGALGHV